jgi:diacylglycerol O-acyltransferase / wax synthase
VPRLRQRLYRAPPGCGRPFWADDPAFDLSRHVRQVPCPASGDERALLDVATVVIGEPLPRSRPLWSATFVAGLAGGGTGLVVVMNHVLADGIGGLAVLAGLVDEGSALPSARAAAVSFPAPAPRGRGAGRRGLGGPGTPPGPPGGQRPHHRQGLAELGDARPPRRLPRTSLNRPTGPRRRLDVITADLAAVRGLGHAHGGTVNDVILAAVTGALRAVLAGRGEQLDSVTVSVPVSARLAPADREAKPQDSSRADHPHLHGRGPVRPRTQNRPERRVRARKLRQRRWRCVTGAADRRRRGRRPLALSAACW